MSSMYGVGGAQVVSGDVNPMFSSTLKHSDGEFVKSGELINSDLYQQQQQQSTGLMRYRSAPSSFYADLMGDGGRGAGCDDIMNTQSSSSDSETMFAKFLSCNDSGDSGSRDLQFPAAVKLETADSLARSDNGYSKMICQIPLDHGLTNHRSVSTQTAFDSSYKVTNPSVTQNLVQVKSSGGNCSNLIRQSSSPAGFFSNLTSENGFSVMRNVGNFRMGSGSNGEDGPSTSRLNDRINFSSEPRSCSRFMPKIAENRNGKSPGAGNPCSGNSGNAADGNTNYVPGFTNDSWSDPTITGLKRKRDGDEKIFSGFEIQNGDRKNYIHGLTHHLSLPKTSSDMTAVEKIWQFQPDSVPCKIRAKRGCATHPRSIAERNRRTRISERMKKLQDLFPSLDKQANTAEMLDLAVQYIKDLQKQVQALNDNRANCKCLSNRK